MKVDDEIQEVNDKLFGMYEVKSFTGRHSAEVNFIKSFEEAIVFVNQYIPRDPKTMTVLEFYQTVETIKKQTKKNTKINGQPH